MDIATLRLFPVKAHAAHDAHRATDSRCVPESPSQDLDIRHASADRAGGPGHTLPTAAHLSVEACTQEIDTIGVTRSPTRRTQHHQTNTSTRQQTGVGVNAAPHHLRFAQPFRVACPPMTSTNDRRTAIDSREGLVAPVPL